jgi:hypothetical protein
VNRAILEACLPCLAALVVSFGLLRLVVFLSGARCNLRRLWQLHRCEHGGVQSLAFVITLPLFIVIVQFIVQVSQLMIGTMVVNYAAFAAARAASVWLAADVDPLGENNAVAPLAEDAPLVLTGNSADLIGNLKYQKIFAAAALACAPVAPSRDLGFGLTSLNTSAAEANKLLYSNLVPSDSSNTRIPRRIDNKLAYSFQHTAVRIAFVDKDTRRGPTYNPRRPVTLPTGEIIHVWDPHEIGWQDPVTVSVTHNFALLPGPGRFLAKFLVRADGQPDRISPQIDVSLGARRERIHTTSIWASATFTNEGVKSVIPYKQVGN